MNAGIRGLRLIPAGLYLKAFFPVFKHGPLGAGGELKDAGGYEPVVDLRASFLVRDETGLFELGEVL